MNNGKYSPAKFANFVCISIRQGKAYRTRLKCGKLSLCVIQKIYKICKFRRAIFSITFTTFPNQTFAILLLSRCSYIGCDEIFCHYCLDKNL